MSNQLTTLETCLLGPNRVIHVLKPDRTSMERPLTVRPYLYGRYILGIFWVYMKVFLTKSKNRKYNVNEYRPNIP